MGRIIGILILVVQVLAIIDVARTNKETLHKVLWILAIIFFPVLGCIAWYLVSRRIINV